MSTTANLHNVANLAEVISSVKHAMQLERAKRPDYPLPDHIV
jgi:hypothetical protein